jgi:hypothetical protein
MDIGQGPRPLVALFPSAAFGRHCSYRGMSRRSRQWCMTVEDDPFRTRLAISPDMFLASEIRLIRIRDRGLLSWEPLGVFGANMFPPLNQRAAIRYGRRPGHRKGAFILDRE